MLIIRVYIDNVSQCNVISSRRILESILIGVARRASRTSSDNFRTTEREIIASGKSRASQQEFSAHNAHVPFPEVIIFVRNTNFTNDAPARRTNRLNPRRSRERKGQ